MRLGIKVPVPYMAAALCAASGAVGRTATNAGIPPEFGVCWNIPAMLPGKKVAGVNEPNDKALALPAFCWIPTFWSGIDEANYKQTARISSNKNSIQSQFPIRCPFCFSPFFTYHDYGEWEQVPKKQKFTKLSSLNHRLVLKCNAYFFCEIFCLFRLKSWVHFIAESVLFCSSKFAID